MSGDVQIETKKIETEAKPILLTASASFDCFVQEMYAQPKTDSTNIEAKTTDAPIESTRDFRELLEKGSLADLRNLAVTQKRALEDLHEQVDKIEKADPAKRAEMAKAYTQVLEGLSSEMKLLAKYTEQGKSAAKDKVQKGIENGKIDLSDVSAALKFEVPGGTLCVKGSDRKLSIRSGKEKVTCEIQGENIVEIKDGVERTIGRSNTRQSYVYNNGHLQKLDPNCKDAPQGPVFELGGDTDSLKATINPAGSNTTMEYAGVNPKTVCLQKENKESFEKLNQRLEAAQNNKPAPGPNDGKDNKGNKDGGCGDGRNWPGDVLRPGSGRGEGGYGGSSGSVYPGGERAGGSVSERIDSGRVQGDRQLPMPVQDRQAPINLTPSNLTPSVSDSRSVASVTRAQVFEMRAPISIDQRSQLQHSQLQQVVGPISRLDVPVVQSRQAVLDSNVASVLSQNYYQMKPVISAAAQGRMEPVQQAMTSPNTIGRVLDLAKLQAPWSPTGQSPLSQIGYNPTFNNPANALAKQLSPANQYQQFSKGDPLSKISALASYQSFSTPNSLYKTANSSLNSFGKSLQEVKDMALKDNVKTGTSSVGSLGAHSAGRRLADLVADKAPGAHTSVTDKWAPVKAISGGSAAGGDVGPFIPISGRVGGAGASTGARGEGSKGFGTKPDGSKIEGAKVQGGSAIADGGKKVEGVKNVEGTKSNGGSAIADGGKRVEGIKNVEGTKSNGGSAITDGGKRVDSNVHGASSGLISDSNLTPAATLVGQTVGVGGSVKDGKATRDDKEGQRMQGESQAIGEKDPGFGYTPRRSPYTVKQGETLESIARQRWGDERLAELIRTINLHRLQVIKVGGSAILKLSAGDVLWLPSPIEAERFKKVCDIKGDGQRTLTVGFSV